MAPGPELSPGAGPVIPASRRGSEGFFHVAQQRGGQWSCFDPAGRPFYIRAVHDVANEGGEIDHGPAPAAAARLRGWGFNAAGAGDDGSARDDGLPYFATVDFCRGATVIVAPGVRLPDVFAPDWPARAQARAVEACAGFVTARELIGWLSDDRLAWGHLPAVDRPGLLQVCLSLEPGFAAYHAAWEFLLALHAGSLDAVALAWSVPLANKEVVRELTKAETGIVTRGYLRDEARWAGEFARRYFNVASAALRAVDSHHLFCGCRGSGPMPAAVLAAAAYPAVDVPLRPWAELPAPGSHPGPMLAADVAWSGDSFRAAPATAASSRRAPRLTSVERMLRRARTALRRLARHPAVVGYFWRQWRDEPGEQPPFASGLVHVGGAEARENTELIADFNSRVDALRRAAAKQLTP